MTSSKLISIDTNILVRIFVKDYENQSQFLLVKELLRKHPLVYISQVVQTELVWVLESNYKFDRAKAVSVLKSLQDSPPFILEKPQEFQKALALFETSPADFSDYLIFSNAIMQNYPFWTFDKKLAKTQGVNHLKKSI